MKHVQLVLLLGCVTLSATFVVGQTPRAPGKTAQKTSSGAGHQSAPDRGQQVFDQNCSRCHNAPEGFPPNISGTIATHMRVRANLSDADYKALLRYLNP